MNSDCVLTDKQIDSLHGAIDDAYVKSFGPWHIVNWFAANGYTIVPTTAVPTPEDRAAVGRLVDWVTARHAFVRAANAKPIDEKLVCSWAAELRHADKAIQPGDIEAARRVAEGGGNG